jgi:plasmid stability protein
MPVNLSIKNVPDALADRLRRRAELANRSLQGELMTILEAAVYGSEPLTPRELLDWVRKQGLATEADSVDLLRADRNGR